MPILLPLLMDRLVRATINDFEAVARDWRESPAALPAIQQGVLSAWVRVRLMMSSSGVLAGLHLRLSPEDEADQDLEFDIDLSFAGEVARNEACLKDGLILHWISNGLRDRMAKDGRELAHLSDEELEALLVHTSYGAASPQRWMWRFDELTTYEAAILERECREGGEEADPESHHRRLTAIGRARPLRERRAAEIERSHNWWRQLRSDERKWLTRHLPLTLSSSDRIVVAARCTARMIEEHAAQHPPAI